MQEVIFLDEFVNIIDINQVYYNISSDTNNNQNYTKLILGEFIKGNETNLPSYKDQNKSKEKPQKIKDEFRISNSISYAPESLSKSFGTQEELLRSVSAGCYPVWRQSYHRYKYTWYVVRVDYDWWASSNFYDSCGEPYIATSKISYNLQGGPSSNGFVLGSNSQTTNYHSLHGSKTEYGLWWIDPPCGMRTLHNSWGWWNGTLLLSGRAQPYANTCDP